MAALIVRDGKILLGKRRGSHGAGSWCLPGGHLEWKEEPAACVQREVKEETGLDVISSRPFAFTNDVFAAEEKHYVTLFLLTEVAPGDAELLEPEKCESWGWFPVDDLPSPLFLPIRNLIASGFDLRSFILDLA